MIGQRKANSAPGQAASGRCTMHSVEDGAIVLAVAETLGRLSVMTAMYVSRVNDRAHGQRFAGLQPAG